MKSTKTKKPKTSSWYIKKCDIEFSKLVREKGVCEMAGFNGGCGGVLQDAHIIGRSNYTLRWDILNHLCLCYRHHIFFAHHNPVEFVLWFEKKFPQRFAYLIESKNKITKRTLEDYQILLENIKAKNLQKLVLDTLKI